ncbi:MAG: hypothetical protein AAFQ65_08040 [Myxococcota bacterium]
MTLIAGLILGELLLSSPRALIVTNNRSLDLARPDLRYADDDGAQWAELFTEFLGDDAVRLLTRFDPESALLHPGWTQSVKPPSRAELSRAVDALVMGLKSDRMRFGHSEVYLVFAGHGDLDQGLGFLELEDGRFTAADLESLIAALPADRVHLILDSCNSYFMLNPRSPSVERWEPDAEGHKSLLEKLPHVGAIISTSAEALTYEWSEIQSGVFSYELRSGLRGAADVDGDERVSYRELEAFVDIANRNVINELYRPKVFSRAPTSGVPDSPFLDLRSSTSTKIHLASESQRRITFRDERGIRVMDVHKEPGTKLVLRLPSERRIEVAEQFTGPSGRASLSVREIPPGVDLILTESRGGGPEVSARGESRLFRELFGSPFGEQSMKEYLGSRPEDATLPFAISNADVERLELHLESYARAERDSGFATLVFAFAVSDIVAGGTSLIAEARDDESARSDRDLGMNAAWIVGGGLAGLVAGLTLESLNNPSLALLELYREGRFDTVDERTATVLRIEREFRRKAKSAARNRKLLGVGLLTLGGVTAISASRFAYQVARDDPGTDRGWRGVVAGAGVVSTLAYIAFGSYSLTNHRTTVERAWEHYQSDRELFGLPRDTPSDALSVSPWLGEGGSFGVALGSSF